jgi:hypothetical protein
MNDTLPIIADDLSDAAITALQSRISDQVARLPRLRAGDETATAVRRIRDDQRRLMLLLQAREADASEGCSP